MNALWQSVLGEIELSVSHATFTTWYKNTELVSQSDDEVVIAVPNIFAKKQFEVKFNEQIKRVLAGNGVAPKKISYTILVSGKKTRVNRETTLESPEESRQNDSSPASALLSRPTPSPLQTGNLNPRYTFDNFIVGSNNDLAYTASQAVAASPGVKYNPQIGRAHV